MKDSHWAKGRTQELLEQIEDLRRHAWEDGNAWAVSLKVLSDELKRALQRFVTVLETKEKEMVERQRDWTQERVKLEQLREADENDLRGQMKRLEDQMRRLEEDAKAEAERLAGTIRSKEAELDAMRRLMDLDAPRRRRRRWIRGAAFACLAAAAAWHLRPAAREPWTRRMPLPYGHPSALAVSGGEVWIADWVTRSVYRHSLKPDMPLIGVYSTGGVHVSGLAVREDRMLATDRWDRKILRLELQGTVLSGFDPRPSPGISPDGLAFDGADFWSADPDKPAIYRHRDDGSARVIAEYPTPNIRPRSLFRRGDAIWVLDGKSKTVFRKRLSPDMKLVGQWEPMTPSLPPDGAEPVEIAVDAGALWVLTANPAQLLRYPL